MEKYCVKESYTIREVIEQIDRNKDRIAIVVNEGKKVTGVVSQGDIIRALLAGKNLYTRVGNIIQPKFLYQNKKDMKQAYKYFRKLKITLLPIVDDDFNLTDVVTMEDIYYFMEEQCKN